MRCCWILANSPSERGLSEAMRVRTVRAVRFAAATSPRNRKAALNGNLRC